MLTDMNLFVTGTDTGSGKTYVTCLLLTALRARGIDAVGFKPISCGDRDDGIAIAKASGDLPLDTVNPIHLQTPVSPYVACLLENHTIQPSEIISAYQTLAAQHEIVIVEGAGGWEVPILENYSFSDLAKDLQIPVLLVAGNKLGALNHTLLSINAIKQKAHSCVGIILNQLQDELDTAMITNKGVLETLAHAPLLDHLIHGQDFIDDETLDQIFHL